MLDDLRAAGRQARSLGLVEHRPWPLPAGRWVAGQTWEDLLFAHWRVSLEEVRRHVARVLTSGAPDSTLVVSSFAKPL